MKVRIANKKIFPTRIQNKIPILVRGTEKAE